MKKSRNTFSLFSGGVELLTDAFKPIERKGYKKGQYLINTRKHLEYGFRAAKREAEEARARKLEAVGSSD